MNKPNAYSLFSKTEIERYILNLPQSEQWSMRHKFGLAMSKFIANQPPDFSSLKILSAGANVMNFFNPCFWLGETSTEPDPAELIVLFRLLLEKKFLEQYPNDDSIKLPPKVTYHSETDAISGSFEDAASHLRQYGRMRFGESGALILRGDSRTICFHPIYTRCSSFHEL